MAIKVRRRGGSGKVKKLFSPPKYQPKNPRHVAKGKRDRGGDGNEGSMADIFG